MMIPVSATSQVPHLFEQTITSLLQRNKPGVAIGGRKMDIAKAEGEFYGWQLGHFESLAYYATQLRIEAWPPFIRPEDRDRPWVESVYNSSVRQWFRTLETEWGLDKWKNVDDEAFFKEVYAWFLNEIVFPENIRENMESHRKANVLAGLQDPKPEDREWIEAEREKAKAAASPFDDLIAKLDETPA